MQHGSINPENYVCRHFHYPVHSRLQMRGDEDRYDAGVHDFQIASPIHLQLWINDGSAFFGSIVQIPTEL